MSEITSKEKRRVELRTIVKDRIVWILYSFEQLKTGDIYRMFDDGENPVEDGEPTVATSDAFAYRDIGVIYSDRFKQTINEWAAEDGYVVLDPDGFDRSKPDLMITPISKSEFDKGVQQSTTQGIKNGFIKLKDNPEFNHTNITEVLATLLIQSCGFTLDESLSEAIEFTEDYAVFEEPNKDGNFDYIHADSDGNNQNVTMSKEDLAKAYATTAFVAMEAVVELGMDPYKLMREVRDAHAKV